MWNKRRVLIGSILVGTALASPWGARDDGDDYPFIDYDHPAVAYNKAEPEDAITRLQQKLDSGEVKLEFDTKQGYLPSLLKQLGINADSQMLVFSKTSFQAPKISPRSPRALYFNDEVAVGFVPNGDVFEFTALDPKLGINFYTIERSRTNQPRFLRRSQECLSCHMIANTLNVPGLLATSVIPRPDGSPRFTAAATVIDSRTPLDQRWGGWYVTGKSGSLSHRGNSVAPNPDQPSVLDLRNNQNVTSLTNRFDTGTYLLPSSDLVALMTLEHQNRMISFLTRIAWETSVAKQEGREKEFAPRLDFLVNEMVSYMLFQDEATMFDPISGTSTFVKTFPERGPRDKKGRSLRDFDLNTRVFRYPLSYMIYSPAFDALSVEVKQQVYKALFDSLTAEPGPKDKVLKEDRQAILEIVAETKQGLPAFWKSRP